MIRSSVFVTASVVAVCALAPPSFAAKAVSRRAATPAFPQKSAKACNDEAQANAAALEKAGESLAAFIHECWWQTRPGTPTPIHGKVAASPSNSGTAKHAKVPAAVPPSATGAAARDRLPSAATEASKVEAAPPRAAARRASATATPSKNNTWFAAAARKSAARPRLAAARLARHGKARRLAYAGIPAIAHATHPAVNATRVAALRRARLAAAKRRYAIAVTRRVARKTYLAGRRGPQAPLPAGALPPGALDGQRILVSEARRPLRRPDTAVLIDTAGGAVRRNTGLDCWGQQVMWWNARDGARWSQSTVCKPSGGPVPPGATSGEVVFVGYH